MYFDLVLSEAALGTAVVVPHVSMTNQKLTQNRVESHGRNVFIALPKGNRQR